jgi:MFS family permease
LKPEFIKDKIKKSLKYSILDGIFYSIMIGFGGDYIFQAYATFLKANNIELGLTGSLPQAIGSISQVFSNRVNKFFKSRKMFVSLGIILQSIVYIPIILCFFLFKFNVTALIFFISLYWLSAMVINPVWSSWMGDLVNENERGKYFGNRNMLCGFAAFLAILIAGLILNSLKNLGLGRSIEYSGFVIIFVLALIARLFSYFFVSKQYEPKYVEDKNSAFKFSDFIKKSKITNFGTLIIFLSTMNFAVTLSSPFFAPYILKDLKFSYLNYTLINACIIIIKNLFMPVWGKMTDKYGTKKVISFSGIFLSVLPVFWLFSGNLFYLLLIQMIAGFVWAGFELSSFNFLFDATNQKNRMSAIGIYNAFNGIAIFLGGLLGGLIVKYNNLFWSKYLFIFLLSGILRLIIALIFIPRLKEARDVEHITYKKLVLNIISSISTSGIIYNFVLLKSKKYVQRIKDNIIASFFKE